MVLQPDPAARREFDHLRPDYLPSTGLDCSLEGRLLLSGADHLWCLSMKLLLRPGSVDDESSLLGLFDEAVLWLTDRGLGGQWGTRPWSERVETKERVARLANSSGVTVAEVEGELVGALEVDEVAPSYAPVTDEPGLYVVLLIASRRFIGQGIGGALLDHARSDCLARGLRLLRVDCWAGGHQQLVRYYESAGFTATESFDRRGWPGQLLIQRLAD